MKGHRPLYALTGTLLALVLSVLAACGTPATSAERAASPTPTSRVTAVTPTVTVLPSTTAPSVQATPTATPAAIERIPTATPAPAHSLDDCQEYLELDISFENATEQAVVTSYRCHNAPIDSTAQSPSTSPTATARRGTPIDLHLATAQQPAAIDVRLYPGAGLSASFLRWPEELPVDSEPVDQSQPEPGTRFQYLPQVPPGAYSLVIRVTWPDDIDVFYAVSFMLQDGASTSDQSSTEATAAPTAGGPVPPSISAFQVTPIQVDPGDTVTLTWQARGERAMLCPSSRFVLFTSEDCQSVPLAGERSFTLPQDVAGNRFIDFLLTVEGESASSADPRTSVAGPQTDVWHASVALRCDRTWFFSDEPPAGGQPLAGVCPLDPIRSPAAAQHFERGTMIWLERPGRTWILEDARLFEGEARRGLHVHSDPLDIVRDTSAETHPPAGLYAPLSGFGLVWRGDVQGSPGYQERLGWALAPEFAYQALYQCDDALPSGGRSWQTCYLLGPDGEVIILHPLGGWYLVDEQEVP